MSMFAVRHSISRKFMLAVMVTTLVAVLVSGLVNLGLDLRAHRDSVAQDIGAQADILAQMSFAALDFDDPERVATILDKLRLRRDIQVAAVYRADGSLFAQQGGGAAGDKAGDKAGGKAPARLDHMVSGYHTDASQIALTRLITRGSERLGAVYLVATYPLQQRIVRNTMLLGAVMALSLAVAALVSSWLQAGVTRPLAALTRAVQDVVSTRQFSGRVAKTTQDEIGTLVDAFNGMLGELGARAALLEQSNASLQAEVRAREQAQRAVLELNNTLEQRIATRTAELEGAHEQLRHAQKMEAIGQLTGGVAHDFNNVLQVIAGNLQLLKLTLDPDAPAQQRIETARAATARGARLSSQLLSFARRQPLQPVPSNLSRILREMDDMLRRALGEAVELETVVSGGLWNTLVDPNQLENVILNLAINARDAMQGQGRLTLELGNALLDDLYAASEDEVRAGQYVMLAISDNGAGMPPEVIARAFEPFFTTKKEGEGTGLGLSMAFGFVKQSGGHIKIYSEVGSGTTIKIYLPRSTQIEVQTLDLASVPVRGGSETILVVEDDLAVQATTVDMLRELGYTVLKADNGDQAAALLRAGVRIDFLFTDVVMPGAMRSPELARLARQLLPDLAVLFTSGYTQNAIVHGGRLDPGVELISKPYRREDLARKIRHMLGNRQQARALPAMVGAATAATAAPASGRRILLVEDQADNRDMASDLLTLLGYEVTALANAEAALAHQGVAENGMAQFDVLITDLNLPGMNGLDLAVAARQRVPGLRVVLSSGSGGVRAPAQLPDLLFLPKPYTITDLQQVLS